MSFPYEFAEFGGLDLTSDPQEVAWGRAINAQNVLLSTPGRVKSRAGYATFGSATALAPVYGMQQITPAGNVAVVGPSQFKIFSSAGALVATDAGTPSAGSLATLGSPGAARTFAAVTTGVGQRYWDGAAFANGSSKLGQCVCVTPWDNRLVLTGVSNTVASQDAVWFSGAGNGTGFGANDFENVSAGDGEAIVAAVTWRDRVFVFKQTKFFVFTSTSADGAGNPVFNHYTVAGIGAIDPGQVSPEPKSHTVAVGRDGVYFLSSDGVYVTTGGVPQRISGPLDAWFRGDSLPHWTMPTNIGLSNSVVGVVGDFVYVCPNYTQSLTFVYDVKYQVWTAYDWAITAICPLQIGTGIPSALLAIGTSIFKHSPAATTDNGVAIAGRYRAGFWEPQIWMGRGSKGRYAQVRMADGNRSIRQWWLDGSGTVTLKFGVTDSATLNTGQALTLGTAPAVGRAYSNQGAVGRNFSYELSGSGAWSVSRVIAGVN